MGQIPTYDVKCDKSLLVHRFFVPDPEITDLWKLDLIGIEDSAETRKKNRSKMPTVVSRTQRISMEKADTKLHCHSSKGVQR